MHRSKQIVSFHLHSTASKVTLELWTTKQSGKGFGGEGAPGRRRRTTQFGVRRQGGSGYRGK